MTTPLKHLLLYAAAIALLVIIASFMADPKLAFGLLSPAMLIGVFGILRSFYLHAETVRGPYDD